MVWKVFLGVLGALLAYTVIVLVVVYLMAAGARQEAVQQLEDFARTSSAQREAADRQREVDRYQGLMRRSVCRDGKAVVPRRQGSVTYYDPVTWHGQVSVCK